MITVLNDRYLKESDVIKAIDNHRKMNGMLDDDIECILDEIENSDYTENSVSPKEERIKIFENDDIILEQRGKRYYLSLYDEDGFFQREITVSVKDNYKVTLCENK